MKTKKIQGVPDFSCHEFHDKQNDYCLCIPIINEGQRILNELKKAYDCELFKMVDIILCDGGSTDGSMELSALSSHQVNTLLTKLGPGKQGAQLRMGFYYALERGYKGVITIDGNDKDSIQDVPDFIKKLKEGYDFVQGSRFIRGGKALNTPLIRYLSVRLLHAPIISLTAKHWFTDTTNAYRAYSRKYLTHSKVKVFRDIFYSYELLAYLSTRASQLKLHVCEIPVARIYPNNEAVPTKISKFKGNFELFKILFNNLFGKYN